MKKKKQLKSLQEACFGESPLPSMNGSLSFNSIRYNLEKMQREYKSLTGREYTT